MEPLSESGVISDEEFECLYAEALLNVRDRYMTVGVPYRNLTGGWLCDVSGTPRDEYEIFALCWNHEIAEQIRAERVAFLRQQQTKQSEP